MRATSLSSEVQHARQPVDSSCRRSPVLRAGRLRRRGHGGRATPGAVSAGRGARLHQCHRRPEQGHREPPRRVHQRPAGGRRALQLRRRGPAGSACERRHLRGALPRQRHAGRRRELGRRRDDDRPHSAAASSASTCGCPAARTPSTRPSRCSSCSAASPQAVPPAPQRRVPSTSRYSRVCAISSFAR